MEHTPNKNLFELKTIQVWHVIILFAVIVQLFYIADGPQRLLESVIEVQKVLVSSGVKNTKARVNVSFLKLFLQQNVILGYDKR